MKAYKKKKLAYENGYLMKDGKVVVVDPQVVRMLNKLDVDVQKARHETVRKFKCSAVSEIMSEDFERETERYTMEFEVDTPSLDEMTKNTMKLMEEIDACNNASKGNDYLKMIDPVVQFVANKKVLDWNGLAAPEQFDLPIIGNPLELDADTLMSFVNSVFA